MSSTNSTARSRIDDNIWAECHIDPKVLSDERELIFTRWPDYQFLSPLSATQLFADVYVAALKAAVRRHYDPRFADPVNKIELRLEGVGSRRLTQFWKARQKADALGVEYQTYIEFNLDFAARRGERRALPQPNQQGPAPKNPQQATAWAIEWHKHLRERLETYHLRPAALPQYHLGNFAGLVPQRAFRAKVLEQAAIGVIKNDRLYEISLVQRCIPLRAFAPVVGRARLIRRIGMMRDLPGFDASVGITTPTLEKGALWQSCFALPHARDDASSICQQCPQAGACRTLSTYVESQVVKQHGTTDPIGARRREKSRARTQKSREEAKARAALPGGAAS